ncbi:HEC/Ndc80p family domain-containing protein [Ditylenchus destructor]|uniref:Kinetochore protein NDC80 n=1 Tax=Ditylenchus destructor TaxID=166010 RepID=A0AAD4QYP1_9BILA|nr:HEC/Ndc80p family domain-containing protein [Ditylenchus destructor]
MVFTKAGFGKNFAGGSRRSSGHKSKIPNTMYGGQKSHLPVPRTPASNRSDFARASVPASSASQKRMDDPARNSMAPGFDTRSSVTMRPSLAVRNSLAPGSLSGRMSLLPGNSKRLPPSIISGKMGTIKDTRNVTDKAVVTKMVYNVLNFFDQFEGVPFAYSEKIIRAPRKNDFKDFFQFIFGQLVERYRLDIKAVEDEVPKLLIALGYPYPIKKSTVATLGAQHSWPSLLGALDWLIELVYIEKDIRDQSLDDQLTFSYFITCYKKQKEQPGVASDFTDEINRYRELLPNKIDDMDTELDELKSRRLNNEKDMLQIKDDLVKDQEDIRKIDVDIDDLHTDVTKLEKYNEEVLVQLARIDDNILREEIASMREKLSKCEEKHYAIQPQSYKQLRELQNTYKGLMSSLQGFCSSIPTLTGKIDWCVYDFDAVLEEFMNPTKESSNRVEKLMERLRQELQQIGENCRLNRHKLDRLIKEKQAEIQTIEAAREQKQLENKLEVERYHREVEDSICGIRNANMSSELLQQKHQTAKDELQELNDRYIQFRNKHLEVEKKYIAERNHLEKLYNDIVAENLDKVSKLYKRFNELTKCKDELKELGEQMLRANHSKLQSIHAKKTELHL